MQESIQVLCIVQQMFIEHLGYQAGGAGKQWGRNQSVCVWRGGGLVVG